MRREKVFYNFVWRFLERCGAQGVTLIVSIILARLLEPKVYGTLALVTVFTTILQAFVDGGLGNALIQKKDADDLDFSSVFYFNIAMCLFLYGLMFFAAPLIAAFYNIHELIPVVRVVSLTLIISGVKNIEQAYVSKNMMFKKFFFATLGGTLGAAVLGIWLAYKGYGIWALVAQNLFNQTVDTVVLWVTVRWHPKKVFSWTRLRTLLAFGWKLLASRLIDTFYNEFRSLVIGKIYSSADLAFYNKGRQFPNLVVNNINDSIDSVLFPTMSNEQKNPETVKNMTRRSISASIYVMAPLLFGLAFCAEPLVKLILTEKWLPCVFYLRVFCVSFVFYPIHTANLNAIKAMGRSDIFLKLELLKKGVGIAALAATMFISVEAMAVSTLAVSVINQVINSWPNKKLLGYSYISQIKDIFPQICIAALMGVVVYTVQFLPLPSLLIVCIQAVSGACLYIGLSILFKIESYHYMRNVLKDIIGRHVREKED